MVIMLHQAVDQNPMVHSGSSVPVAAEVEVMEVDLHVAESVVTPTTALSEYDINLKGE